MQRLEPGQTAPQQPTIIDAHMNSIREAWNRIDDLWHVVKRLADQATGPQPEKLSQVGGAQPEPHQNVGSYMNELHVRIDRLGGEINRFLGS